MLQVTFAVGGFAATPAEALEPAAPPEPVVAQREDGAGARVEQFKQYILK